MVFRDKNYICPKLPAEYDLGFIRIGGAGLANCMFVAARAWLLHKKTGFEILAPTWGKFSPGPYLRGEKDKRHYFGLFKNLGISGLKKLFLLATLPKIDFDDKNVENVAGVIEVKGLGRYFEDLLDDHALVLDYFHRIIKPKHFHEIKKHNFENVVGVHIRLGDYSENLRTDIQWYKSIILNLNKTSGKEFKFYVFSDGTEEELLPITSIENVKRVFFGNALADILALSKCRLIIGSDSTFSGWGAFLGQVPIIFAKRHFGNVLLNSDNEIILGDDSKIPSYFIDYLNNLT